MSFAFTQTASGDFLWLPVTHTGDTWTPITHSGDTWTEVTHTGDTWTDMNV